MTRPINAILAISIIVVLAAVIGGIIWWQFSQQAKDIAPANKQTQQEQEVQQNGQEQGELAGWKTYTNMEYGFEFRYPGDWYVKEDKSNSRIYIRNVQSDVNKGNMLSDFQQVWISTWTQEVSAQTENNVKMGKPDGREIMGSVSSATINSNGTIINTYEYETIGGPTLQAFWTDKAGKRYYATNSTEVGKVNQQDMVKNLKKILSTFKFTK